MLSATRPHRLAHGVRAATLPARLYAAATAAPQAPALVDSDTRLTYADLVGRAERFAAGLHSRGVGPGDVVLIQLPNWWETVVAVWGTWLAGGVVLPVVPIYRAHELGFILDQVRPAAVVTAAHYRGYDHAVELRSLMDRHALPGSVIAARSSSLLSGITAYDDVAATDLDPPPIATDPDDIALVLYTSGTTSSPKGVLHSHRTLLAESASIRDACALGAADRVFMPSPLSHITGLSYAVVLTADLGAASVLLDRWDAAGAVEVIEAERCTFTVSATPFLRGLAETYEARAAGGSSLRTFVCGGADIPPPLVLRAGEVMGTKVLRTYGSTEMPTLAMARLDDPTTVAAFDEGPEIGANQMQLRATQDGMVELVCRGPELFLGYLDAELNEHSFTPDGYFRTGDAASIENGRLRISGRIKDIINRGGEKYSAAEVEWALLTHPLVAEVSIVGYPDDTLGERACAFVVARGDTGPSLTDLREHLLEAGFAVQKAPERLEIVASLPRTASGKIQKFRLRQGLGCAPVPHGTERG
ncbi:putative fatty-acid--CoA ligase [metagenome]|uniref:Putative fatty-acid--CoA ligase n=1 Tax=metagenome TaxID=256318 RepID=A0A2P2CCZ1_9ZZZZ